MQPISLNLACLGFIVLFVGRVLALEITIGTTTFPPSQFLAVPDQTLVNDCQADCAPAMQAIQKCGDSDDNCLCDSAATIAPITACEQCLFTDMIHKFKQISDPRGNPTAALQAYSAACFKAVNVTIPATVLAIAPPSDWSGPVGIGLGVPATVVAVIFTTFFGSGLIYILNTM